MKLNDLTVEELESMGYDEIAYLVLLESGKKQKLLTIFKKICSVLKLDFESQTDNVTDFFELLSTNKKFIMLDNGYWDLQINHKVDLTVEEEIDETLEIEEEIDFEEEEETKEEENIFYDGEETDDSADDDLADLVIVDPIEEEEAGVL